MSAEVLQKRLDKKTAKLIELQRQLEAYEMQLGVRSRLVSKLQHAPDCLEELREQSVHDRDAVRLRVNELSKENAMLRAIQTKLKQKRVEVEQSESQGQNLIELQESILELHDKLEGYKGLLKEDKENIGDISEAEALNLREGLAKRLSTLKAASTETVKDGAYWKERFVKEAEECSRVIKASEQLEQENRLLEEELTSLENGKDTPLSEGISMNKPDLQRLKTENLKLHTQLQKSVEKFESHKAGLKVSRVKQMIAFKNYSAAVEKAKASETMKQSDFNYIHRNRERRP
eukprot:CAMPEP_0204899574 /NCGR_PEP_ID=MMETSP1397-20131031/1932_1 /ASSEMBLY_ACC=CAM_ASM_000891 /TAXON_ID=49980 /ORGANISM="Climacostomum Climacostomum virens, Strain Stock W-24" /LENGTH=289 /DNA_ID=CAMNT_0052067547 /DNA_START=1289 /DNA_END=2158 /DNA_ORIENTATION=+